MGLFSFPKREKLKSKKVIHSLFEDGQHLYKFPLRLHFKENELDVSRCGFSVPKRHHRKAVSRNLLKRKLREAYRLNKQILGHSNNYDLMILFIGKKPEDYQAIEKAMIYLLNELALKNAIADR